jgi:4-amino-4-deoxy-L-arabinose transferase-like glycosyltransferase
MFWRKKTAQPKEKKQRKEKRYHPRNEHSMQHALDGFVVEEIEIGAVPAPAPVEVPRPKGRSRRKSLTGARFAFGWIGLWLLIVAAGMVTRGVLPTDETRLLALAWDMWQSQTWLLPRLNGEPWFGQSPVPLWLILAGWKLWGVNEWWPRLLPALAGFCALVLGALFARMIWPDQKEVARYTPLMLLATGLWAVYQSLAATDLLIVCATLITLMAVYGFSGGRRGAWAVLGASTGLGLLTGGLVSLVYVLPAMLLAPFWAERSVRHAWGRWYGGVVVAMLLASAMWFGWLYPAAATVGLSWQQALSKATSIQRLDLFYQHGPWWWYLYLIPLALFPWSVWPLGWMRLWHVRGKPLDSGFILCLVWALSTIVLLTVLPVRQPQLLLPMLPAFILLLTWLLMHEDLRSVGEDGFFAGMTFPVIAIGFLLAILPGLPKVEFLPAFLWQMSPFVGVAIAALGIVFSWTPMMNTRKRIMSIAVTTMFVVVAGNFFIGYEVADRYRTGQLDTLLYEAENEGRAIAHVAPYQGEFHFKAHLTQPVTILTSEQTRSWILQNPNSLMVTYRNAWQPVPISDNALLLDIPYGNTGIRVWNTGLLLP